MHRIQVSIADSANKVLLLGQDCRQCSCQFLLLGIAGKVDCQHRLLQGCYMWGYMLILLNSMSPCCSVLPAGDC